MAKHGTANRYKQGCRCDDCRGAQRDYTREYKRKRSRENNGSQEHIRIHREALADLLHELCPMGLTDDCPARRRVAA